MNVKLDTKEKFTVISPEDTHLSANMTEEFGKLLHAYLQKDIPHIVLNLEKVATADEPVCESIAATQGEFYKANRSFVICNLSTALEKILRDKDLFETMNTTNSESEAWDIVQMEEIERELLSGEWD